MSAQSGHLSDLLGITSIIFAVFSAAIAIWYLLSRPPLNLRTKLALLLGVGIFPITTALTGNVSGFIETKNRRFCSGCHVMLPYTDDSKDRASDTLAAIHGRNHRFGSENCYTCHADYGMFGSVATKLTGLVHVYHYYGTYRSMPIAEALPRLHLYKPFPNANCTECHSTTGRRWRETKEHASAMDELKVEQMSCVSAGCHGPVHPFSKTARVKTSTLSEAP